MTCATQASLDISKHSGYDYTVKFDGDFTGKTAGDVTLTIVDLLDNVTEILTPQILEVVSPNLPDEIGSITVQSRITKAVLQTLGVNKFLDINLADVSGKNHGGKVRINVCP